MTLSLRILSLAALLLAAGCVTTPRDLADQAVALPPECGPETCAFRNTPLRLLPETIRIPGRSYDFNRLADDLEFFDSTRREWVAPRRTLTDGASIPEIFVPIVGNPREKEFTHAAALHDAYCGVGNEAGPVFQSRSWQEVHRLLYDALIAGGTSPEKAKVMFAAVWLGGPRWYGDGRPDPTMARIAPDIQTKGMRLAQSYIRTKAPTLAELIAYLRLLEREMIEESKLRLSGSDADGRGITLPEDPTDRGPLKPPPGGGGPQPGVQP